MSQATDQDDRSERSNSSETSDAFRVPVSPSFFYQSPRNPTMAYNQKVLNSPKLLPSLLSSPLFAPAASRSGDSVCRSTANDEKSEKGKENRESSQPMQEITVNEKKRKSKPARVSIAAVSKERKHLGRGIALFGSESEHGDDEPISKKQRQTTQVEQNQPMDELHSTKAKDGSKTDYDLAAVWAEATSVVPVNLEGNDGNPYQGSIHKLENWTKELLALKKKLEGARVG